MKIKKLAAALAASALVTGGLVFGVATSASAHTPSVTATCEALTVDLTNYAGSQPGEDAVPAATHDVAHHDLLTPEVAAVPGTDAVPAVPTTYVQEWKFVQKNHHDNVQWKPFDWNPGYGWDRTSEHRDSTTVLKQGTPEIPAVPGTDAIPATFHDWTETVIDTPAKDAVPAKANHVTVTIDGAVVTDQDFSHSYSHVYGFGNQYVSHTWSVVATAWDDDQYNVNQSGTTEPCAVPVGDAKTAASVTATCGAALVEVTNPEEEYSDNLTGAVTIWIDGEFTEAVAVAGDATETRDYAFSEDSGDHTVVVKNAESAGGEVLAQATVVSDCIAPQPEAKVTSSDWTDGEYGCGDTTVEQTRTVTTTPYVLEDHEWVLDTESATSVTETQTRDLTAAEVKALDCPITVVVVPPTTPAAPVVVAAPAAPVTPVADNTDVLAHTGSDLSVAGLIVGLGLLISGSIIGSARYARRRAAKNQA